MSDTNATVGVNQFIPAGSEVVLIRDGQHFWHTTKENVPVSGAESVDCPIRAVPVLSMVYKGFRIWFLEGQLEVELSADQINNAKNLRLVKLEYDIPATVSRRGQLEHPSQYLWRYGVRTSGSMWTVPHDSLPLVRLRELTRNGCNWRWVPVDVSGAVSEYQRAIAALQNARVTAYREKEQCERNAEERLNTGQGDINVRLHKRRQDQKRIDKEFAKKLENVEEGAKALGIPVQWTYYTVTGTVQGANVGMKAESVVAADKAGDIKDRLEALGTDEGKRLAQGLYDGTVPVGVAADYLQDNEETKTEEKDENVFSLVSETDE